MEKTKNSFLSSLVIGLKLLLICAIIAGVVAFVYNLTKDKYAENQEAVKAEAIGVIFDLKNPEIEEIKGHEGVYLVKDEKGKSVGFCVEVVEGSGYGGDITMMVGYDYMGKVCGVEIISHSETPGLGSNIESDGFRKQFLGTSGKIDYSDVDGISGATYSSKAVTAGINKATAMLTKALKSMGGAVNE